MNPNNVEAAGVMPAAPGCVEHAGLTREQLRKLSRLNPLRSSFQIVAEWVLIVAAIYAGAHYWNPLLYLLMVVFIGARQHALLILMHEGTHYRLSRHRRLNDWVGELLLAWPFFVTMRSYRRNHIAHHLHMNTDRDPDWRRKLDQPQWRFPKHWAEIAWLLFSDVTGLNAIGLIRLARSLAAEGDAPPRSYVIARLAFYLAAAVLIVISGGLHLFLLYWVVPYFTWLAMILHVRSIAEHFSIPDGGGIRAGVRTTHVNFLERLLVAPNNVNYHAEHHRFPSVPFYRLPELHRLLSSSPDFAEAAHLSDGYLGVLSECSQGAVEPKAGANTAARYPLVGTPGGAMPSLAKV
ncbi:MAG TPA: fatty acid desaturase family protein [Candidatus Binataceae bacterium]|nr:fatty acid desaturase family protein [Candidatus Binataceae bacterium]